MRPFAILEFSFMQLSATICTTRDQQITGIQTGTMTLTFILLTSTITTVYYQSCKPGKFKGGTGEGRETTCLLKFKNKNNNKKAILGKQ